MQLTAEPMNSAYVRADTVAATNVPAPNFPCTSGSAAVQGDVPPWTACPGFNTSRGGPFRRGTTIYTRVHRAAKEPLCP